MKKLMVLLFAAGLVLGGASCASAIDFKAEGEWLFGFGVGDGSFLSRTRDAANGKVKRNNEDKFQANQRIRLQLEAVASENLSGTLRFQIGDQPWGKAENGGALGADGKVVGVLNAYIDWMPPDTELKVRMGLQPLALPNVAGGSSILDTDSCAAVALSYQFTENVGLSFFWARPWNDNYLATGNNMGSKDHNAFVDNIDLFALSVPLTFDGVEVTPFIMYGLVGANAHRSWNDVDNVWDPDGLSGAMTSGFEDSGRWNNRGDYRRSKDSWHSAFWAGLPIKLTLWDPFNIEFEFNYGVTGSNGYGTITRAWDGVEKKYKTRSEGWLAKALVEYKMDWGTPGIFGWYASGDDDNPKNGSERMPAIEAKGNFTTFMGDGNLGWAASESWYDRGLNYAGTWGIGLQIADMSFIEDLKHTFRVAYIGGTNSPSMAKYANNSWGWATSYEDDSFAVASQPYLTTKDGLVEFNFLTSYQMYENFEVNFDFAYVINCIDRDTWKKAGLRDTSYSKRDAWRANLTFAYTF